MIAEAVGLFPTAPIAKTAGLLSDFIYERLAGSLREQGYSAQEVDAVLALRPQRLGDVAKRLAAVRAFAALPEAAALAAANKRIGNILKKADRADAACERGAAARARRKGPVRDGASGRAAGRRAVRCRRLHRLAADPGRRCAVRSMPSSTR